MGKRSDFERNPRDYYRTPPKGVKPLLPFIGEDCRYIEPMAGDGALIASLPGQCVYACDIEPQGPGIEARDAFTIGPSDVVDADYIITNPPWDRKILHRTIEHFRILKPTWLLFDTDWAHTKQSSPYIQYCHAIVSIGRLKWIAGTKMTGKDNCCWYLFKSYPCRTEFIGR